MKRFVLVAVLIGCSGSGDEPGTTPPEDSSTSIDTAVSDTGIADTTATDSAPADTATDTSFDAAPVAFSEKLSAMDLYSDIAKKTVHPKNLAYAPTYELWSDAASKSRWIMIPAGQKIDNTDMDHWAFPTGTRLWKEFAKDGKRLETRLIEKTGDDMWRYGSYVWNDSETEATWTTAGATSVKGTTWDVPKEADCQRCHDGEPSRILGFQAFQLDKGTPLSLAMLADKLKTPVAAGATFVPPGTDVERKALGYLAANCGNCHNPNNALVFIAAGMDMHLYGKERDVKTTQLYLTSVNQATEKYVTIPYRIKGGDAANSAVYVRMQKRDKDAMPPLGSKDVHTAGLATIKAWIDVLPKP
jgi:hypothetical protein